MCKICTYHTVHGAMKGKVQLQEVVAYNLDVIISVGYRVKSIQGTRFRQWATRVLREMLLNRLEETKRIGKLERRMDAAETDLAQLKGGVSYLVKQIAAPPNTPPRRRIGFGTNHGEPQQDGGISSGQEFRRGATTSPPKPPGRRSN